MKIVSLSFDDGTIYDLKFIDLLNKYNLKATLNLNSELEDFVWYYGEEKHPIKRLKLKEVVEKYKGHEVASHSLTHPYFSSLNEEEVIRQLVFEYGFSINIINNTSYDNYCHLVNMTWGGDGSSGKNSYYDKTEEEMNEIKRKISESKKGKKRSEETIRRISKNHANMKGENNPMYGKKGKDAPSSKTVICLTTNRIFLSAKSGGIFYDCDPSTIIKCCRGVKKSCGKLSDGTKLVWRYLTIIEL